MFGDRMVLMEVEDGASGGGGGIPIVQKIFPNSMKSTVGSFAEGTLPQTWEDAPDPEATEPQINVGASTDTAGGSRKQLGKGGLVIPGPKKTKAGESPWNVTATVEGGVSPDVLYAKAAREKRIADAETLDHLNQMRASGASEQQMMQWAQVNDDDAEIASTMAREHFPRMRDKVRQLQQDVDDARSLKVNPYNWHESIGRGGRVAAAFAALTGGFAAGKANPNTAIKMMDAAIERDIAAQEQNIKNEFEGLKMQKGLLGDERALYDEQLNSMNKIRAVKYAATVGRLQAVQQHAVTEAHHLAIQTTIDHFELKLINSIAAAQKEVLRLELDGPLRNASQLAAYKKQIAAYEQQLAVGPRGGMTVPTEKVSTLSGDTVGQRPEAEIVMGGQQQKQAAPGRAGAVGSRRAPSTGGTPSEAPTGQQEPAEAVSYEPIPIEDDVSGMSRMETQDEATQRGVREEVSRAAAAQGEARVDNVRQWAQENPDLRVKPHIAKEGSFARVVAEDQNKSFRGITTWDQALDDIGAGKRIRNDGMTGIDDAEVVAEALKDQVPRPEMYKGGADSLHYKAAMQQWKYAQDYPEILERDSFLSGEYAKIRAGGKWYTIMPGSRDKDNYKRIREETTKMARATNGLEATAKTIRTVGLSGLFRKEEDGSYTWQIPGLTNDNSENMMLMRNSITAAMTYIKTHDPTARISDKDLEVGFEAAANYMGKGDKFVDFIQSIVGNDTKRRQIEKYLARVVVEAQRIWWTDMKNDLVPDYNTLGALTEQYRKVDDFVQRR